MFKVQFTEYTRPPKTKETLINEPAASQGLRHWVFRAAARPAKRRRVRSDFVARLPGRPPCALALARSGGAPGGRRARRGFPQATGEARCDSPEGCGGAPGAGGGSSRAARPKAAASDRSLKRREADAAGRPRFRHDFAGRARGRGVRKAPGEGVPLGVSVHLGKRRRARSGRPAGGSPGAPLSALPVDSWRKRPSRLASGDVAGCDAPAGCGASASCGVPAGCDPLENCGLGGVSCGSGGSPTRARTGGPAEGPFSRFGRS